jgi:hypothetical protein
MGLTEKLNPFLQRMETEAVLHRKRPILKKTTNR